MRNLLKNQQLLALVLVVIGVSFRWLPHPPNFAPIAAIALIGSLYLNKKISLIMPLIAMLVSDVVLGFYGKEMLLVYGCFLLTGLMGWWVRRTHSPAKLAVATVGSSVIFYLVTNFGVWLWSSMYSKDLMGLANSYILALPFFRNTLAGDIFFTTVLFSLYQLGIRLTGNKLESAKTSEVIHSVKV